MLKIRLARAGKKNQAQYKIVVAEHKRPVKGKFLEVLGNYNPRSETNKVVLNKEKVAEWIKNGAQPSDTVLGILKRESVLPKHMEKRYEDNIKRSIAKAQNKKASKEKGEDEGSEGVKDAKVTEDKKEDAPAEAPKEEAKPEAEKKEESKEEDKA